MPWWNTSGRNAAPRFTLRVWLIAILRGLLWSAIAAAALTAIVVMRTSAEFQAGARQGLTWFSLFWLLCFVPALAAELGAKYLQFELGPDPPNATKQ